MRPMAGDRRGGAGRNGEDTIMPFRFDKLTLKSQEAVQKAQAIAAGARRISG